MENIPGTDRPGPGDMEMADIIGIEWNERLHNTAGWAGTNVATHIRGCSQMMSAPLGAYVSLSSAFGLPLGASLHK